MTPQNHDGGRERLQKVLARAGVGSRRGIEELIAGGRIRVNGAVAVLGQRVDAGRDRIEVDGSRVPLGVDLVYYLLYKPAGAVTSAADPQGRPVVTDWIDPGHRVWPVGRLDIDTEGALILTNDGDLTLRLTHPRYHVPRTYVARVQGAISGAEIRRLTRSVPLDDAPARAATAVLLDRSAAHSVVRMTIHEGRNRQVRRMFDAIGHPVMQLVRTGIGPLQLGRLKPGAVRRLNPAEVRALFAAASVPGPACR